MFNICFDPCLKCMDCFQVQEFEHINGYYSMPEVVRKPVEPVKPVGDGTPTTSTSATPATSAAPSPAPPAAASGTSEQDKEKEVSNSTK